MFDNGAIMIVLPFGDGLKHFSTLATIPWLAGDSPGVHCKLRIRQPPGLSARIPCVAGFLGEKTGTYTGRADSPGRIGILCGRSEPIASRRRRAAS
jgi:hypothetical protein